MKKYTLLLMVALCTAVNGQITLNHTHTGERYLTKFKNWGYMTYGVNPATQSIDILDTNNALFKSIAVPFYSVATLDYLYLSDNLFDTDSLMEFAIFRPFGNGLRMEIYNETGSLLFGRNGVLLVIMANISGSYHVPVLQNNKLIYYDGASVKMRLRVGSMNNFEVYDLPGTLPCDVCVPDESPQEEDLTGLRKNKIKNDNNAVFFPNPVRHELKLKYELPSTAKKAGIKIYDVQGKQVREFPVSGITDYILLPTEFDNGLYFYSLEVDGQLIKTEKIVLTK